MTAGSGDIRQFAWPANSTRAKVAQARILPDISKAGFYFHA
jgi:hypothetical protein